MKFLKSQLTTDLQLPLSPEFYSPANPSQELSNIINSIEKTEPIKLVNENNISKEDQNALTELTTNPNIIIQKENKVNAFVILDKEFYFKKLVKCDPLDSNMLKLIVTVTKRFFQN